MSLLRKCIIYIYIYNIRHIALSDYHCVVRHKNEKGQPTQQSLVWYVNNMLEINLHALSGSFIYSATVSYLLIFNHWVSWLLNIFKGCTEAYIIWITNLILGTSLLTKVSARPRSKRYQTIKARVLVFLKSLILHEIPITYISDAYMCRLADKRR